jgi:hypothetical protein
LTRANEKLRARLQEKRTLQDYKRKSDEEARWKGHGKAIEIFVRLVKRWTQGGRHFYGGSHTP